MREFPVELHEAIIDAAFVESMGSCSLVTKSWLPRSRYHLFGCVDLRGKSSNRIFAFVALLESTNSTIAPYIRRIELDKFQDWEGGGLYYAVPRLSALPHVRTIIVASSGCDYRSFETMSSLLGGFTSLSYLLFDECEFANMGHLANVLAGCSQLEHLKLNYSSILRPGSWKVGPSLTHIPSAPLSLLKSVHIAGGVKDCNILQWLVSGNIPPELNTLCLHDVEEPAIQSVVGHLQALGPALKTLNIGFQNRTFSKVQSHDTFCCLVDFGCNSELQVFALHSLLVNDGQGRCFPKILGKITSSRIRAVLVGLRMLVVDDLDQLEWENVDTILQRPNYALLQKFIIGFEDAIFGEGAKQWMKETFPLAFQRGVIKVVRLDSRGNPDFLF